MGCFLLVGLGYVFDVWAVASVGRSLFCFVNELMCAKQLSCPSYCPSVPQALWGCGSEGEGVFQATREEVTLSGPSQRKVPGGPSRDCFLEVPTISMASARAWLVLVLVSAAVRAHARVESFVTTCNSSARELADSTRA